MSKGFPEIGTETMACVTGQDRRPRPTPHEGRHLDGCQMNYPCGCSKRYYSSYYNKSHGFNFHSPDKTFIESTFDGRCEVHYREYMEVLGYFKPLPSSKVVPENGGKA